MANSSSSHWKVGVAFVLTCVTTGTLIALVTTNEEAAVLPNKFESSEAESSNNDDWHSGEGISDPVDDLTYQELLQRNGDVDGRTKDYFTPDGDAEFGGAVVGMAYSDFRDRLLFAGFRPVEFDRSESCSVDPDPWTCHFTYPETQECMGTGEAYCSYVWSKGQDRFTVTSRDAGLGQEEHGGEVIEMTYDR